MAEVDFFTTTNGSLNTSLQEGDQYCERGSLPVRNENNNVVANDLDGKLDNGELNSVGIRSLPTQDGDVPQNMEQTLDSVAVDVEQTSSEDSLHMRSDLSNNEDSKTQCSSSENQECNGQMLIPPNASSLAQTNNSAPEILKVSADHISTDTLPGAPQSSEPKSGLPLPLSVSLVSSATTSPYFTRSAKKARLSSPITHENTAAQSTTCSFVTSGMSTTSILANSSKPVTTSAILPHQKKEPALTISASTLAQDESQTTVVTSGRTSLTSSLLDSSKPITTFASSLHGSNEPAASIFAPTGASDGSQTTAITSVPVSVPVSQIIVLCTIPAPFSNQVNKQDDPGSTSSLPRQIVTPQMLTQALATCTLPIKASATSTMEGNSSASLAIPSLANKVKDLEPTSISSNMETISSLPSTSSSKALVAIPIPMTKLDPEVPITSSNVTANVAQTAVAASPIADNATSKSMPNANSSTASPDIPAIFPDFTPCSKCNSILVCSCPGPSSIGEDSGAVSTTCQAGCQGDCKCNGMKANQVDGLNLPEQDVKPQIFPVVVSI